MFDNTVGDTWDNSGTANVTISYVEDGIACKANGSTFFNITQVLTPQTFDLTDCVGELELTLDETDVVDGAELTQITIRYENTQDATLAQAAIWNVGNSRRKGRCVIPFSGYALETGPNGTATRVANVNKLYITAVYPSGYTGTVTFHSLRFYEPRDSKGRIMIRIDDGFDDHLEHAQVGDTYNVPVNFAIPMDKTIDANPSHLSLAQLAQIAAMDVGHVICNHSTDIGGITDGDENIGWVWTSSSSSSLTPIDYKRRKTNLCRQYLWENNLEDYADVVVVPGGYEGNNDISLLDTNPAQILWYAGTNNSVNDPEVVYPSSLHVDVIKEFSTNRLWDSRTVVQMKADIDIAIASKGLYVAHFHTVSASDFTEVCEYIQTQVNAGNLEVMTIRDLVSPYTHPTSTESYLVSQDITTTAHWKFEDFPTGIETLTFTGNDIIGQEDLTASPWTWNGSHLTVVDNGANTGPFGLTNSYRATKTSTTASVGLIGNNRTVTAQKYRVLLWARGTSTGTAFEMGTLNGTWGGDGTAEILFGPGSITSQAAGRIIVEGLRTTEWTLIEYNTVVQTASSLFDLLMYPGSVSNTTNGYAIDFALAKVAPFSENPSWTFPEEIVADSSGNGYNLRYSYQGAWNEFPMTSQTTKFPSVGAGKLLEAVGTVNRGAVKSPAGAYPSGAEPAFNTCINFVFSEGTSRINTLATLFENYKANAVSTPQLNITITTGNQLIVQGNIASAGDLDTITTGSTIPSRLSSNPMMLTINIKSGGGNCDIYYNGIRQPVATGGAPTVIGASAANDSIHIGNHGNTGLWGIVNWELRGNVYDVRVFDSVLTDAQVKNLYGHVSQTILSNNQSASPSTFASISPSITGY